MTLDDLWSGWNQGTFEAAIVNGWIVPASMVILYIYGRDHFNQPGYAVEAVLRQNSATPEIARLTTPAPPMFTTRRRRYILYAHWYILILELAFLFILCNYDTVVSAIKGIPATPHSQDQNLIFKAMVALFTLTSVLSSFPFLKQVDTWLLSKLHQAACIPDDVRYMAAQMRETRYVRPPRAYQAVVSLLTMRDTRRVANQEAVGSLEEKTIDLLCLRTQLDTLFNKRKYLSAKTLLNKDTQIISAQAIEYRRDILLYLRDQELMVPEHEQDIDMWIASHADSSAQVADLSSRRQRLLSRCDGIIDVVCLVASLLLLATEKSNQEIDLILKEMGFDVAIKQLPLLDWDAVAIVVAASSAMTLIFNSLFVIFNKLFVLQQAIGDIMIPDKQMIVRFVALFAVIYSIVILLAIKLKRYWRSAPSESMDRPENLLIGVYSYFATILLNIALNLYINHGALTGAPFIFALNQVVLGYFIGIYIDRSLEGKGLSWTLPLLQGGLQTIVSMGALYLAIKFHPTPYGIAFSVLQSGISGFLTGVLFQRLYKRREGGGGLRALRGMVEVEPSSIVDGVI